MKKIILSTALLGLVAMMPADLRAQTSTAGSDIDVEVYDPADGDNGFCVTPGGSFTARVYFSPGSDSSPSCTPTCGPITGGSANVATGVIDIAFDTSMISYQGSSFLNFLTADGLFQDNSGSGRVGWAYAGDWSPDANTTGALADPCVMSKLTSAGDAFELSFDVSPGFTQGSTTLHLRTKADGFNLSFADACANGFDEDGGLDEIIDGIVGIAVSLSPSASGLSASSSTIPTSTGSSNLTTTVSDGSSNLPGHVVRVEVIEPNYSGASISAVADQGDGTYSSILAAGALPGRALVRYAVDTCDGTFVDYSDDQVILINDPAYTCDSGDANGDGLLTPADATAVMLEYSDGDTNINKPNWSSNGTYLLSTACADANGDSTLSPTDATAVMLMWLEGM